MVVAGGRLQGRLEGGGLVNVSSTAERVGLCVSVAMTIDAWRSAIGQPGTFALDERGRLWEVLWIAARAASRFTPRNRKVTFTVRSALGAASAATLELTMRMVDARRGGPRLVIDCAESFEVVTDVDGRSNKPAQRFATDSGGARPTA